MEQFLERRRLATAAAWDLHDGVVLIAAGDEIGVPGQEPTRPECVCGSRTLEPLRVPRSCRSTPGPLPFLEAPERKLVGFAKVDLDAGERANARIDVEPEQLSYWDESRERWITPAGEVRVYVGSSATDARLAGRLVVE